MSHRVISSEFEQCCRWVLERFGWGRHPGQRVTCGTCSAVAEWCDEEHWWQLAKGSQFSGQSDLLKEVEDGSAED